jgi:hypothetical protein
MPTVAPARAGEHDARADEASSAETPTASDLAWRADDSRSLPPLQVASSAQSDAFICEV